MKASDLIPLLDDRLIEQRFREELAKAGISRSSIPKRLYRKKFAEFRAGWRKSVIEHLQGKPDAS